MDNTELYNQMKDLLTATKTAINAETKASSDMINLRIDTLIEHQEKTNGKVVENYDNIKIIKKQTRFIRWIARNPHYAIPLFIVIAFGIYFILAYFGIELLLKI